MRGLTYDYKSFSLANGESDYDVADEVAELFNNVPVAKNVAIKFNYAISLKINTVLMPSIDLGLSDSPFQLPNGFLEISNLFLTNESGATCTVKILIW